MIRKDAARIRRLVRKNAYEVVIYDGVYIAAVGSAALMGVKCHKIAWDHGALKNQLSDRTATLFRRIASCCSDHVVALTELTRKDYRQILHSKREKVICIQNPMVKPPGEVTYDSNSHCMVSAARLEAEKGMDLLIEVAVELKKRNQDWRWDIWGDGSLRLEMEQKIQQYQLQDYVILKGNTCHMTELYHEYGICVLTSYREGLPMVLLEAKANRLPLVSFDAVTGPGEIIQDGVDGYLIPPYDVKMMAEKLDNLLRDKQLRIDF